MPKWRVRVGCSLVKLLTQWLNNGLTHMGCRTPVSSATEPEKREGEQLDVFVNLIPKKKVKTWSEKVQKSPYPACKRIRGLAYRYRTQGGGLNNGLTHMGCRTPGS